MANTLCIDQGNTFTKACVFIDDKIVASEKVSKEETKTIIAKLLNEYKVQGVIISSVVHTDADTMMDIRDHAEFVLKMDANTRLPIMNAYGSPDTLGADRIAMAVAAQAMYPGSNVLAISLGTCVTYNFVQKNGAFRGGAISPGMNMRLRAMNEFTDKLPPVSTAGDMELLGYDTETSMRSGAVNGLACELDGMIQAFSAQYPDFNAVLTGGDLPVFANKLKNKIFADPELLMKGLNLILKHNVPQLQ